jgi:hypothetical protein
MQKLDRESISPLWCLLIGASLLGCPSNELAPIEPCTVSGVVDRANKQGVDEVDLLFMIDNSSSMTEEQDLLAAQLPILAQVLAAGELELENGEKRTFTPVRSLHLGVISSDMGLSGANTILKACEDARGDDGKLLTNGLRGCQLTTNAGGNHLSFTKGETDVATLGDEFACISTLGIAGCGLEQQLEAMLKAVTPGTQAIFSGGSTGHGDGFNAGFLRSNSVLALIAVTDEEDCSIPDTSNELFVANTEDPRFQAPNQKRLGINSRCGLFATSGMLHPISRYVDGFKALRPTNPDLVVFGAIAGVPEEAEGLEVDGVQNFDAILGLPDMKIKFAGDEGVTNNNLEAVTSARMGAGELPDPACVSNAGAMPAGASPARRFVEVAKGFGKNGIIRSICANSFASAMNAIIDKIANQLSGACLDRTLNPNDQGIVECDIVEYLPVGMTSCDAGKGRTPAIPATRFDEMGVSHTACKIAQVAVNAEKQGCAPNTQDPFTCLEPNPTPGASQELVGWYYDDFTAEVRTACKEISSQQRIAFTPGAEPPLGATVQFECLQPVFTVDGEPFGKDTVNKQCEGQPYGSMTLAELASEMGISEQCKSDERYPRVRCQPATNTCQIMCEADANCPDAWVCNKDAAQGLGFCINPTCPN